MEYEEFIAAKSQRTDGLGFEPIWMPDILALLKAAA